MEYVSHKYRRIPAMYNNMNETRGHSKWNKPNPQILHNIIYMWNLSKIKLKNREEWFVMAEVGRRNGEAGQTGQRVKTCSFRMKTFWRPKIQHVDIANSNISYT